MKLVNKEIKLGIVGLGYVGLPLAVAFSKKRKVVAYDNDKKKILDLKNNFDITKQFSSEEIVSNNISFSSNLDVLKKCNCFIITVPSPIDKSNKPDFKYIIQATKDVASILKKGGLVIYESTVYPGATEEICIPIIEKISGLVFNRDFFCGYSPERINPGDKEHTIENIIKITSGSSPKVCDVVDSLYKEIVKAGTHKVSSIKVAEAAKVIENTQRDINIALMNELSQIFKSMKLNTEEVLQAAETKWNFLSFRPGLVGGHCIGVDPYYLTHKAEKLGYNSKIILAGRKLNDSMSLYVADEVCALMRKKNIKISSAKILIMGITFKENCPDYRNSKILDIVNYFKNKKSHVDVCDPWVNSDILERETGIKTINNPKSGEYDVLIISVAHKEFKRMNFNDFNKYLRKKSVIYDVKRLLKYNQSDGRL